LAGGFPSPHLVGTVEEDAGGAASSSVFAIGDDGIRDGADRLGDDFDAGRCDRHGRIGHGEDSASCQLAGEDKNKQASEKFHGHQQRVGAVRVVRDA
jgi:hypothetical protein